MSQSKIFFQICSQNIYFLNSRISQFFFSDSNLYMNFTFPFSGYAQNFAPIPVPLAPACLPCQKMNNVRHKFTPDEDQRLSQLVAKFGARKWEIIAKLMPNRSARQCRDRYSNYLKPGFFSGEWSKEEDALLMEKFKELGPRWSQLKEFFRNRSPNQIKNRWNYFVSRLDNSSNISSNIASSESSSDNEMQKDEKPINQNLNSAIQMFDEDCPPFLYNEMEFDLNFGYDEMEYFNI